MEILRRRACRALLLTPNNSLLLLKIANPNGSWVGWITPGGGINEHEDEVTALKRELLEELGLKKFEIGPKVWRRDHSFPWRGRIIEQSESYFLIRIDQFVVQPKLNPDHNELLDIKGFRWWSVDQMMNTKEELAPRKLPVLLKDIISNGPPHSIIDVGV